MKRLRFVFRSMPNMGFAAKDAAAPNVQPGRAGACRKRPDGSQTSPLAILSFIFEMSFGNPSFLMIFVNCER